MAQAIKVIFPDQGETATIFIPFQGGNARSITNAVRSSRSKGRQYLQLCIPFASLSADSRICWRSEAIFLDFDQVCESKGWPATQRLRLIAAGRELYDDDVISAVETPVIHCIVLSNSSQHSSQGQYRQRNVVPCSDWVSGSAN